MLIEVRVQLNGTLRQDLDRVASAIREAKTGLRYGVHIFVVFGPVWERNDCGHITSVKYRVSDTYPSGDNGVWKSQAVRMLEFPAAQGGAEAA